MAGNLPETGTPYIGRRRELAEVRSLLGETRVLMLIGPGGVGKSRLASAVAADRRRAFPDGVWYVDLDGLEDLELLVTHLTDVLGAAADARRDGAASLARSLRDKHLLLLLDNCEHLIDGVGELVDALAGTCPKVRILGTSRAPLRAAGYVTYQVPPLEMPPRAASCADKDLDGSDAVRFFVGRARRVLPTFELTADNRSCVHELVRRLDRLPLALELAAAQLRSLTVPQLVERMAGDPTMLDWGSAAETSRRQQTLRGSLRWSAELCSPDERWLWARLSVFRGTFDLDAVEAVCADPATSTVLDPLQGLVERSIVVREDHGSVVRYSMLEVIRQFGAELSDECDGAQEALRARHTAWFLHQVRRADAEWNTARQAYWLRVLPLEHKNIVHALGVASGDPARVEAAAEAVFGLWRYYWWACGWAVEGAYWADRCTPLLTSPALRARLLLLGSLLTWSIGDAAAASALLRAGRLAAEESGDGLSCALAEHVLGDAAFYRGQHTAAVDHFRRALATYDAGSAGHRVDTLLMLTLACAALGDVEGAETAHRDTLLALAPGERFQRSYSLLYVGEALRRGGVMDRALIAVREALRLKAELHDPFGVAWTFAILAAIAGDKRRHERAATLLGAADRLWKSMSIDPSALRALQIGTTATSDRALAVLGAGAYADRRRRGEQLEPAAAVAVALQDGAVSGTRRDASEVLTRREAEIAELVALGLTNRQVGAKLVIAQRTADAHVQNILTKLGFTSRAQVVAWVAAQDVAPGHPVDTVWPSGSEQCSWCESETPTDAVVAAVPHDGTFAGARTSGLGVLTTREMEIAELVALGLPNRQIAERLTIAQRTADVHVQNILTKLGFTSRAQVMAWVARPSGGRHRHPAG